MQTSTIRVVRDPALALIVRIFVGGVADRWGLPQPVRDDLRLAASELFSGAVELGDGETVDFTLSADHAEISLEAVGIEPSAAAAAESAAWDDRFSLIRALFPQAEVADSVRIRVSTAAQPS